MVNVNSTELVVFEAAIDLMSYVDIFADYESNKLALGMLADAPLETFLRGIRRLLPSGSALMEMSRGEKQQLNL